MPGMDVWWWCLIPPPARPPRAGSGSGSRDSGTREATSVYVCLQCRNYLSRDSEGNRPHLRMVAISVVVVCRALSFGIYAFIWGDYPVGGSRLEGGVAIRVNP